MEGPEAIGWLDVYGYMMCSRNVYEEREIKTILLLDQLFIASQRSDETPKASTPNDRRDTFVSS